MLRGASGVLSGQLMQSLLHWLRKARPITIIVLAQSVHLDFIHWSYQSYRMPHKRVSINCDIGEVSTAEQCTER